MKSLVWLTMIVLGVTACGGVTTATTTAPTAVQAGGPDLSGLGFEVHQEPG
jgi:hypothetical protein